MRGALANRPGSVAPPEAGDAQATAVVTPAIAATGLQVR